MYTNQPCVQLYTGNFLADDGYPFKGGLVKSKQMALCLETQHMPDSINHDNFTNVILDACEKYDYTTIYAFSAE
jgi:aldose 1-epimerase